MIKRTTNSTGQINGRLKVIGASGDDPKNFALLDVKCMDCHYVKSMAKNTFDNSKMCLECFGQGDPSGFRVNYLTVIRPTMIVFFYI